MKVTTSLDLSSKKIENLLDPTVAQDAATKAYVDSQVGGSSPYITTANQFDWFQPPTGQINNYVPLGSSLLKITPFDLTQDLCAIQEKPTGTYLVIANISSTNTLVLKNESLSGVETWRFKTFDGLDRTLLPFQTIELIYLNNLNEGGNSRWWIRG